MVQYFTFDAEKIKEKEYIIPARGIIFWYLFRQTIYLLFMIYATLFLAVATPFLEPNSPIVYIIGTVVCIIIALRTILLYRRAFQFFHGRLGLSSSGVSIVSHGGGIDIPGADINYIEYNLLGELVFRTKNGTHSFPMLLLSKSERQEILEIFPDMVTPRTRVLKKSYEVMDAVIMALILAVHIIQFLVQNYYIPTGSMKQTLLEGDHLFAEKITYGPSIPQMAGMSGPIHLDFIQLRPVQRGDIIIFRPPYPGEEDKDYIKRCIAVAGDDFRIANNSVYINGKKLDEPYVQGVTKYTFPGSKIEGIVPEGMVIALGDNRENSSDSRVWGYLAVERIKAKALVLYWNGDQMNPLRSGWSGLDFSRVGLIR